MKRTARDSAKEIIEALQTFHPSSLEEVTLACAVFGWSCVIDPLTKRKYVAIGRGAGHTGFWVDSMSIYWAGDGDVRLQFTDSR